MLALTGIPPLSGFWAKYYVFLAGIEAGLTWLVVVAVISSVISAFFSTCGCWWWPTSRSRVG